MWSHLSYLCASRHRDVRLFFLCSSPRNFFPLSSLLLSKIYKRHDAIAQGALFRGSTSRDSARRTESIDITEHITSNVYYHGAVETSAGGHGMMQAVLVKDKGILHGGILLSDGTQLEFSQDGVGPEQLTVKANSIWHDPAAAQAVEDKVAATVSMCSASHRQQQQQDLLLPAPTLQPADRINVTELEALDLLELLPLPHPTQQPRSNHSAEQQQQQQQQRRRRRNDGAGGGNPTCTIFIDVDAGFHRYWGGDGAAEQQLQATTNQVMLSILLAKTAFAQNFGAMAALEVAGVTVHAEATNFYAGGDPRTIGNTESIHHRYSEWLAWGDQPFIPYDGSSNTGVHTADAYSPPTPYVRGADNPRHQDVCMNLLFVHKLLDAPDNDAASQGSLGRAFLPHAEDDGKERTVNEGMCSTSYGSRQILLDGKAGNPKRLSIVALNTGFITSFCIRCDAQNPSQPGPTSSFTFSHTVIHEVGHTFGAKHDSDKDFSKAGDKAGSWQSRG